ncbi:MAG: 50S ribosomal protein L10 [Candidatus Symbiodolus clandestinus]
MALNLQGKQEIVKKISELANQACSVVVANSNGITVDKMTVLRKECRQDKVSISVVRNTLLERALKGTGYECLQPTLVGPTLIAFSQGHPGAAARLFKGFAKENPLFIIKAAAFEGSFIPGDQIDRLALLPTFEEALGRLMATLREASAGKLVRTLAALRDKLQKVA